MNDTAGLKIKIQLMCGEEIAMGPGKADLLDAIREHGSISAAGRALGMSYRRTWLLVDAMNRCWHDKLVDTVPGGGRSRGAHVTPGGEAIDLQELRGKVVLIDFWAYSCINCQRSIPHVVAWDKAYRDAGLQVIGIHSPEYAFEKDSGNVAAAAADFGITYPVALDNSLATWTNYRNRYWPAHYLIDAEGVVRHIAFGEGNYAATEKLIRELLQDANPGAQLPKATEVADETPTFGSTTRETFLGWSKVVNFAGPGKYGSGQREFTLPEAQAADSFALGGTWQVETQFATPVGESASIRLAFHASQVRIVLAGEGEVRVRLGSGDVQTIKVSGTPRSYSIVDGGTGDAQVVDVEVSAGVEAYSFTFG